MIAAQHALAAGLLGALFVGLGAARATADLSLCEYPGFSPYSASAATLRSCGIKTFPLSDVVALTGGGAGYDYKLSGGTIERILVPPSSFDPVAASSGEREEFGVPPQPPSPDIAANAAWQDEMSRWHPTQPPPYLVGVPKSGAATTPLNYSWSGYVDVNPPSSFDGAAETFTMPVDRGHAGCSQPPFDGAYLWTGLGGFGSNELLQAGFSIGNDGFAEGEAWDEAIPNSYPSGSPGAIGQPLEASATSHQTDAVYVSVAYDWQPSDPNYGDATFVWDDLTTGQSLPVQTTSLSGDYDGSTAEWVAEEPGGFGGDGLEHFSTLTVTDAEAVTQQGTNYAVGDLANYQLSLVPPDGHVLSTASSLGLNHGRYDTFTLSSNQSQCT